MTVRPIIFSGPMVQALLGGRKTQTRRLATSPLRRCQPGDRLYVRESGAWATLTEVAPNPGQQRGAVWYAAGGDPSGLSFFNGKMRPSIHMPRWASRLTLEVEAVRVEALNWISAADAIAEGTEPVEQDGVTYWQDYLDDEEAYDDPRISYQSLWEKLHGIESWFVNPDVVVLTFKVLADNVDRIAA